MKAGLKGFTGSFGPGRYQAAGKPVRCAHCQGELFQPNEAQLNTSGASLVGMDWANRSGTALECTECGLIQWFGKAPERL